MFRSEYCILVPVNSEFSGSKRFFCNLVEEYLGFIVYNHLLG